MTAAVGEHHAEIGEDDRVIRLDEHRLAQRLLGALGLPRLQLAHRQPQVRVSGGHPRRYSPREEWHRRRTATRLEEHVAETQIGLRIVRILGEDLP